MQSVVWQALGSGATLAAALWVSWRMGLAAQGDFGLARSWFDAAAVIVALGLPQGLLHLQYRLKVPAAALLGWLVRFVMMLAVASALAGGAMWLLDHRTAVAVLASLPFAVGHLLARSVLLARRGVAVFGVVTALPALLTFVGVVAYGIVGRATGFDVLLLTATILSSLASGAMAWRSAGRTAHVPWDRGLLWQVSLQSWLQAALGALLAAALLSVVAWWADSGDELGAASLGLHVYQLFAVAAGYVAPVLFDRLAQQVRPELGRWPPNATRAAASLLLLALAGLIVSWFSPLWAPWLLPLSLMLPAGLAAMAARICGTVLLARSAYVELSVQAAWRLLLAVLVTMLALRWLPAAVAVALALLVIELATWWRTAALVRNDKV